MYNQLVQRIGFINSIVDVFGYPLGFARYHLNMALKKFFARDSKQALVYLERCLQVAPWFFEGWMIYLFARRETILRPGSIRNILSDITGIGVARFKNRASDENTDNARKVNIQCPPINEKPSSANYGRSSFRWRRLSDKYDPIHEFSPRFQRYYSSDIDNQVEDPEFLSIFISAIYKSADKDFIQAVGSLEDVFRNKNITLETGKLLVEEILWRILPKKEGYNCNYSIRINSPFPLDDIKLNKFKYLRKLEIEIDNYKFYLSGVELYLVMVMVNQLKYDFSVQKSENRCGYVFVNEYTNKPYNEMLFLQAYSSSMDWFIDGIYKETDAERKIEPR